MDERFRDVLRLYLLNKSFVLVISLLAITFLPLGTGYRVNTPSMLNPWAQWDGEAYLTIAEKGYVPLADGRVLNNFLPGYPFAIRLGAMALQDYALSAFLLSSAFFLVALYYFYRLAEFEFGKGIAKKAAVLFAFFPTAFFFSAVYSEAMFLAFAIPSFYYARKREWAKASVFSLFLPFIRIVGLAFFAVLFVEYWTQNKRKLRFGKQEAIVFSSVLGAAAFLIFSYFTTGSFFGYASQQNLWTRFISSPHVALEHAVVLLFKGPVLALYSLWNLSVLALFIATLYYSRKMPSSYPAYMLLVMVPPLLSSTLEGISRFILVCFPSFVVMAKLLGEKNRLFIPLVTIFVIGLAILTARFVTGAVGTVFGV